METKIDKKLRGGYYTPKEIVNFITKWVINKDSRLVLEPSCGDGRFIDGAINHLLKLKVKRNTISSKIIGVELNPTEAEKATGRFTNQLLNPKETIKNSDFFEQCNLWLDKGLLFDCIIGNPPFIRYQDFPDKYRDRALNLMEKAGLKKNKLMNTWIPFVVGSTMLLESGGRIGFVLPAELFQVNYAAEIRKFLSTSYSKIIFITFRKLIFEGAQQEVVIFLGEKNGHKSHGINMIEVNDLNDLENVKLKNITDNLKLLDGSAEKWTQYFLDKEEIEVLKKLRNNPSIPITKDFLTVDVGVVTGQNKYFVLSKEQVKEYGLGRYTENIFTRSAQLSGIIASQEDFDKSTQSGNANFLLKLPDSDYEDLPPVVRDYISLGEKNKIHEGYKCRIRKKWWVIPSLWVPDAFMLRQVHNYPKLVLNEAQTTVTDTVHRVKFVNGADRKLVACGFLNSLTLAFSEITGRSYGGGVLTFEPSEAERLPLPIDGIKHLDILKIDKLVRIGEIDKVLDITDKVLLKDGLKLSDEEIKTLRRIWKRLRDRRLNRKA